MVVVGQAVVREAAEEPEDRQQGSVAAPKVAAETAVMVMAGMVAAATRVLCTVHRISCKAQSLGMLSSSVCSAQMCWPQGNAKGRMKPPAGQAE